MSEALPCIQQRRGPVTISFTTNWCNWCVEPGRLRLPAQPPASGNRRSVQTELSFFLPTDGHVRGRQPSCGHERSVRDPRTVQTVRVDTVHCRSVGAERLYFTVLFTFSRPKHPYRPVPSTGGSRGHSVLLLYRYRIILYCLCSEVSETLPCTVCMCIARNLHECGLSSHMNQRSFRSINPDIAITAC